MGREGVVNLQQRRTRPAMAAGAGHSHTHPPTLRSGFAGSAYRRPSSFSFTSFRMAAST
jgi:hypothetical protein